jgi:hypothetical protein
MGLRVLFIYPNYFGMNMLPPAIALLSAVVKKEGHHVQLFDTTYYHEDAFGTDSDGAKVDRSYQIIEHDGLLFSPLQIAGQ